MKTLGFAERTVGEWLSNNVTLALFIGLVVLSAGATQLLRAESLEIVLMVLISPFLFTTLLTLLMVTAIAVLFDTIPFLSKGFGIIASFILYMGAPVTSMMSAAFTPSGTLLRLTNDLFGATVIGESILSAAHKTNPDLQLNRDIGITSFNEPLRTFNWESILPKSPDLSMRLAWVAAALAGLRRGRQIYR